MTGPLRVLIVDDVELARQKLMRALKAHVDVEIVGEARDAEEMFAATERLRPDLIFLDITMPEQDGFSALAQIPLAERPLVVFVTAYPHFALDAFRVDAVDYLMKPADPQLLAQALARVRVRERLQRRDATKTESELADTPKSHAQNRKRADQFSRSNKLAYGYRRADLAGGCNRLD